MTTEQLQAARAEKWRQKANPLLTAEDAETWIESTGVSLFLPRKTQLQAPAPSFVEAVLGETNPTPPLTAIQNAFELATRILATEKATPLNLLGTVSEQPDFLVSPEALPYVFALRGDRDWKRGPRDKSSPLVVDSWKMLKQEGALTTSELQGLLGREVTEAAVLRALSELWAAFRVLPIYTAGEATTWELFESRHQKAMQVGGGMAQATALSALISLYLDSVIAASSDEIETFLSPLAPRSRIRDVARGLDATRQLLTVPLGTQNLLHIAGGLPEFPEAEIPAVTRAEAGSQPEGAPAVRERRTFAQRRPDSGPRRERPVFGERPAAREGRKPASPGWKRPGSESPRREWKPRPEQGGSSQDESRPRRAAGGEGFKKPFRPRTGESSSGMGERKAWKPRPQQGEFRPRREGAPGGFKKPYRSGAGTSRSGGSFPRREGAEGEKPREFRPRPAEGGEGFRKPYSGRTAGSRPAAKFSSRGPQGPPRKEWKPRSEGAAGEKPREFRPRPRPTEGGAGFKKPYSGRTAGPRPAGKFSSRGPQRPPRTEWKPRPEGAAGEKPREFRPRPRTAEGGEGFKKPYSGRSAGPRPAGKFSSRGPQRPPRKEWKPRTEGAAGEKPREFRPRPRTADGGEGFKKPYSGRSAGPRPAGKFSSRGPSSGGSFRPRREEGGSDRRSKPAGEKRTSEGRERFDRKKPPQAEGRPAGASRPGKSFSKPGGKSGKSFGSPKSGGRKPAFGAKRPSRPGGKPSFGKRPNNRKGKKSGE